MKNVHLRLILKIAVIGAIVFHAVLFIYVTAISLTYPFEHRDWGEWDFLYQSIQISEGRNPYPLNNWSSAPGTPYTPLFHVIIAPFIRLFGAHLWTGRMLSLLYFLITLILVFRYSRDRYDMPVKWSLLVVTLILSVHSLSGLSIQKYHPNALCLVLGMLSLWFVPRKKEKLFGWIVPLIFAYLSFLAKQPGIAFFVGIIFSGFIMHKWRFIYIALPLLGLAIGLAFALNMITSGGFQFYCFELPNSYPFSFLKFAKGIRYLGLKAFLFTVPLPFLFFRVRWYRDTLITTTLFCCIVTLVAFGQKGSSEATFLFFLVLAAIVSVYNLYMLSNVLSLTHKPYFTLSLYYLLLIQLAAALNPWPVIYRNDTRNMEMLVNRITQSENRALVLSHRHLAYLAEHPHQVSDYSILQFHDLGITTFPDIEKQLQNKKYTEVIVSKAFMDFNKDNGKTIRDLIVRNYNLIDTIESSFYKSPTLVFVPIKP